ncbi:MULTISPECIES: chitinase [unclassified Saccharopolyspora]|uniref:chitinase n=1 Tax=unclassified Saccharopolyspora TaxID=2646250 RepID=UPI001CD2722E|nr:MULTISPECIES: chitinase [unclassified Saccharopolyspora]MCA1187942.1 chitinase [Saccharopolyspora sp. 6T]MCA1194938.1 chitinase [Saccharopolyspora sp. 6V]MCA1226379.1 chitinase [Saccharopolyspora sp. 6M]MCA1279130.1 chitinase [Saccharopolyspora sp. 7B]
MKKLPKLLVAVAAGTMLPLTAVGAAAAAPDAPAVPAAFAAPAAPAEIKTAPYIDVMQESPTLPEVAEATGQKHFTLAFVLGSAAGCTPMWGGEAALDDQRIIGQIDELRAQGGDVIVATGGAMGPYLESVCGTSDELLNAYKSILDTTGSNHLDIDVEATIQHDVVNEALAKLQAERGTQVSYTLRVQSDETGLDPYSLQVLQSAADHGVDVLVNPMAMEFGSQKPWGEAVIAAAEATLGQMKQVWPDVDEAGLKAKLGVTPMIGRNFNGNEFTQEHAQQLVDWANENQIGLLSFWSAGRDNGGCPGGAVSPTCSSIEQQPYEFTKLLQGFGG